MTLLEIQSQLQEFNQKQKQIKDLQYAIKQLLLEKNDKEIRNQQQFKKRFAELNLIESNIKTKMENKYFKFIQHFDFVNKDNNITLHNMEHLEELGCLARLPETEKEISASSIQISNDKKTIHYYFSGNDISNAIYYSFYNAGVGTPLLPKNIFIRYQEHIDNLYEPYFRYYNRNNKKNFVTTVLFEPKKIKEVVFVFNEEVNYSNASCKLLSRIYAEDNKIDIRVENPFQLKTFNITKKSNETIPFVFQFSENNFDFKKITFDKNLEGMIKLENGVPFTIRILSDTENFQIKTENEIKFSETFSQEINKNFGTFQLPIGEHISFETIEIVFPLSSIEKLKSAIKSNVKISLDSFVKKQGDVYHLSKERLKLKDSNISSSSFDALKYIDTIDVLQSDIKFANMYFDKENNTLKTSAFFEQFPFFIRYQHQIKNEGFSKNYFTNILFEVSLKG